MREYKVQVTETLQRTVTVQATTVSDAVALVRASYYNEEIVLTEDDFKEVEFEPF